MAYDLILRARESSNRSRREAAAVTLEVSTVPSIGRFCEITEGPVDGTEIDTMTLEECIGGEFTVSEFNRFCEEQGLAGDVLNADSAAAFLDSKWGAHLTCISLPGVEVDAVAAYAALIAFARERDLRVVDTQSGRDIDLAQPGELPPLWNR